MNESSRSPFAVLGSMAVRVWLTRLLLIGAFLAAWQAASGTWLPAFLVSSPVAVFEKFVLLARDGTLLSHATSTLVSVLLGFLIGGGLGLILGYFIAVSDFWTRVTEPLISMLYTLPRVALIPVLIIWVGIGQPLAVTVAAILVFFLLFYNTFYGIREVDEELVHSVRIMGGSALDVALRVRLPSALVWIVAGTKVSIPQAFVGVVTAEILASNKGLGFLVAQRSGQFDTGGAFAVLLALLIVGTVLDRVVGLISARSLVWKGRVQP